MVNNGVNSAIEENSIDDLIIDTIEFEDCNPNSQACVLTNNGIDTDIIFK